MRVERSRHLPLVFAGLVLFLAAGMLPTPGAAPRATAGGGIQPDLAMAPLSDYRIQWVNGRKMLRFTAMMVNNGPGHFEVRGSRPDTSSPMIVRQILFADASSRADTNIAQEIVTGAEGKWSGDGHNHWHVQEMMRYDLWGADGTFRGAKVGFCFLDSDPWNLNLPNAGSSYYRGSWCQTTPAALANRMGISVGWGDEYEYFLAWQWVDITGLPNGDYTVRANVDPYAFFVETNEENQCWYTRIRINGNSVTPLIGEAVCVDDWSGSPFAEDIAWAFSSGITAGCAPDLFCTNNVVTREQMATFLYRAVGGPEATADYFTDDEASEHEPNINRIAEAGITTGCGGSLFCPTDSVTRAQMASFLVRAYGLEPSATDYFTDDDGSMHEADINALAAAGITVGCTPTTFCPDSGVRRGEMVAFLHRAET